MAQREHETPPPFTPYTRSPRPTTPLGPHTADTYGAGDSFAAALAFALARGDEPSLAVELAARAGAAVTAGSGPYEAQLAFV